MGRNMNGMNGMTEVTEITETTERMSVGEWTLVKLDIKMQ
jgi:hypothetical protein